jgi:hypothetical protein
MLEHQDQKDQTDHQVMQVPQALMVTPEIKDLADPLAHPAHLETQETKDQLATPAKSLAPNPAHQAQPAPTANPVHQALQADLAKLVKTAALALQVPQEMQALQAVQAKLAVPAAPVMQAKTAHLAAANTAHQLVWLQVIKRRRSISQAMFQIRHQPGRLFNNDRNHQFVQYFGLFTTASHILIPF